MCVLCRIPPLLLPWSCPPSRYRRGLTPNLKPGRLTATFRPGFLSFTPVFFAPFSATAVPGLGSGRLADAPAPLRGVRESLRRVLPGPGPLLRLGRHRVFQILSHCQEVGGRARWLNICPLFPLSVCSAQALPAHGAGAFVLMMSRVGAPGSYQHTCSVLLQLA